MVKNSQIFVTINISKQDISNMKIYGHGRVGGLYCESLTKRTLN